MEVPPMQKLTIESALEVPGSPRKPRKPRAALGSLGKPQEALVCSR